MTLATVNGGFLSPIWAVFGMIDLPSYSGATAVVLWTYSLAGVVLLINTLIAMLSLTYSAVHDQAELEYLLVRCERTLTHMNIVHRVRRSLCEARHPEAGSQLIAEPFEHRAMNKACAWD